MGETVCLIIYRRLSMFVAFLSVCWDVCLNVNFKIHPEKRKGFAARPTGSGPIETLSLTH